MSLTLKVVQCPQRSDGLCTAGLYGGRPSPGTCSLLCDVRAPVIVTEAVEASWPELHLRSLAYAGDADAERAWLDAYSKRVKSVGCACKRHWRDYVAANPFDLTNAETYWHSTYEAHAAVSRRIGKEVPDEATARAYWESQLV